MDLVIRHARVIPGDGVTDYDRATILIRDDRIEQVQPGDADLGSDPGARVIDATGLLAIPGVINGHCHGCTTGPLFPSGSRALPLEKAAANACRMLREGVTTLVNLCGLGSMDDVKAVTDRVPIRVKTGTCHTPSAIASARMVDGAGLPKHDLGDVEAMLAAGAVAIGEMGSGASLGGGVTEYKYLPEAIAQATGVSIASQGAREIKEAVVGRRVARGVLDRERLAQVLQRLGLAGRIEVDRLVEIVERVALEPIALSLTSFDEAFETAEALGATVVVHSSITSAEHLVHLCRQYDRRRFTVVAGHANHPSFTPEEAIRYARELRQAGAMIDVSTLDCILTRWMNGPENLEALAAEGLIDTISTDYGGGHWDSILEAVHFLVRKGHASLAEAVAMATSNVARALPLAAPERGLLQKATVADLVLVDPLNPGRVEKVILSGRLVFDAAVCPTV
jgi:imidazolonepropionase-like amidohydrolase